MPPPPPRRPPRRRSRPRPRQPTSSRSLDAPPRAIVAARRAVGRFYFVPRIRNARDPAPRERSSPPHWATNAAPWNTRATTVNDPLEATATSWNSHAADPFSREETTTRSPPRAFVSLPRIRTSTPFFVFAIRFVEVRIVSFDTRPDEPPVFVPNSPFELIRAKPALRPAAATPKRLTFDRARSCGSHVRPPSFVRISHPEWSEPNSGTATQPCLVSENDMP